MAQVIAIGTPWRAGQTTTVIDLAAGEAEKSKRVLLVAVDPQNSLVDLQCSLTGHPGHRERARDWQWRGLSRATGGVASVDAGKSICAQ